MIEIGWPYAKGIERKADTRRRPCPIYPATRDQQADRSGKLTRDELAIVRHSLPEAEATLVDQAVAFVQRLLQEDLGKTPGVAETVHLDHIARHDRVWVARRKDIAHHWIATHPYKAK